MAETGRAEASIMQGRPPLAAYAADPARGRGRALPEPPSTGRSDFARDRDRILHSSAFRRLALKTQVIMPEEGDHHRTRLTHTLEVAQIARSLARALGLDEDLTEALALAHDLGHPPFGHTGEDALNACVEPWGGFDHNAQSLRIVVELEQRYLDFDGLNLTWETLEGLAKRHGPVKTPSALLRRYDELIGLALDRHPGGEAQIAALSDDIAYNAHDLEDGLRAGLIELEDAMQVPVIGAILQPLLHRAGLDRDRLPFALARGMIDLFVRDAFAQTHERLAAAAPATIEAIRGLDHPVAALSPACAAASREVKTFLFERMYRHPRLLDMRAWAGRLVQTLTGALLDDPARMPEAWAARAASCSDDQMALARTVVDYVAGMTDRFAVREHARLCGPER